VVGKGFRIGELFGVKIKVDWSWLFIFLLVSWNLTSAFSSVHPEWSLTLSIAVAVAAALLFFFSVLAHEMAHSLAAIAQGLPVRSITLFLFGGVSNIEREPPSPRVEFVVAIVGPITSVVLGAIFLALGAIGVASLGDALAEPTAAMSELGPVSTLLLWLGPINLILGAFNMIPGFPLDGGRVLRSLLWAATDSLRRATRWASWVGQTIAWLLIVTGIAMVFGAEVPFFGTGLVGGIWLAFIGWFLNSAARQSYQQVVIQDLLEDVPVGDLMRRDPPVVAPGATISSLVHDHVMGSDEHAFPVVEGEELVGIVCLHDIREVDRQRWEQVTVSEVMTPVEELQTVVPEEDAAEALNDLQRQGVRQLPVVAAETGRRLVGLLRRRDILRWLQLQGEDEEEQPALAT
jgi:Zn-dependent protease/CBS domain-containing protein